MNGINKIAREVVKSKSVDVSSYGTHMINGDSICVRISIGEFSRLTLLPANPHSDQIKKQVGAAYQHLITAIINSAGF